MIKDTEDQIVSQHSFGLISQKSCKLKCKYSIILIRSAREHPVYMTKMHKISIYIIKFLLKYTLRLSVQYRTQLTMYYQTKEC